MGARKAHVTFLALTAATIFAASAGAQTIQEAIEVTIENVDVVVVDSDGRPVTGLARDDFELIVDGDPTPIANFYEQTESIATTKLATESGKPGEPSEEPAPTAAEPVVTDKTIFLYFDSTAFGQPLSRHWLIDSTNLFVSDLLDSCSSCRVGLYSRRGRDLHTLVPPARNAALIAKLIDEEVKLQHRAAWASALAEKARRDFMFDPLKRLFARQQTEALASLVSRAISLPGRKILVLVTNQPLQYAIDFMNAPDARLAASQFADDQSREPVDTPFAQGPGSGGLNSLISLCNAAGIAVYPIIAGGLSEVESLISAESRDRAALSMPVMSARLRELTIGVQGIAEATGGRLQHPTSNFGLPFRFIEQELQSYYSLGFRPSGKSASIRVRVPGRRDLTVRARRSMVEVTPAEIARIQAGHGFGEESGGPVRLEARLVEQRKQGRRIIATVGFKFPVEQITWLQRGDESRADLELLFSAIDDAGRASAVSETPLVLRRNADDSVESFSDTIDVALRDASQDLLVVLRDTKAETTSWTTVRIE